MSPFATSRQAIIPNVRKKRLIPASIATAADEQRRQQEPPPLPRRGNRRFNLMREPWEGSRALPRRAPLSEAELRSRDSPRRGEAIEDFGEHPLDVLPRPRHRLDRRRRDHPVRQHRRRQRFEIVGEHVVAPLAERRRARGVSPGQRAARRDARPPGAASAASRAPPRRRSRRAQARSAPARRRPAAGARRPRSAPPRAAADPPPGARATRAGCAARPRARGSRSATSAGSGPSATRGAGRSRSAPRSSASPSPGTASRAGSGRPSTDTCPSFIASSSALCVRGGVRLISSARTRFANTGPGLNSKSPVFGSSIETPSTSEGSRSLVNWMRWKLPPIERASARASVVFPTPGTSSISRWPRAQSAITACRITPGFPRSTRAMFASSATNSSAGARAPPRVAASSRGRAVVLMDRPKL